MSLTHIKDSLGDYAKDIKLNLSKILTKDGSQGLNELQIFGIALACSYSLKHEALVNAILAEAGDILDDAHKNAAKAAATIMAMNNIYYRFVHLTEDKEFAHMPAGLRMQVIMNSGIDKVDFELYALAISAINGCGMCMDSHVKTVVSHAISKTGVQSAVKIASVLHAVVQALAIKDFA